MSEPTISDVLSAIAAHRAETDKLRVDVMDRIDRLQNAVTAIGDDISVNFARADRAVDAAQANARQIEALSREVSGMERQIQRLQTDVRALKEGG